MCCKKIEFAAFLPFGFYCFFKNTQSINDITVSSDVFLLFSVVSFNPLCRVNMGVFGVMFLFQNFFPTHCFSSLRKKTSALLDCVLAFRRSVLWLRWGKQLLHYFIQLDF